MKKAITRKKAYKAMKSIRQYCKQNKVCSEKCIFFYIGILKHCCVSFLHSPASWEVKKTKENMERKNATIGRRED